MPASPAGGAKREVVTLGAMRAPTTITRASHRGCTVLEIHGALAASGGDMMLRGAVHAALEAGETSLILDFRALTTLDSSGLGELIRALGTVHDRGGRMAWVGCTANMRDILDITRVSLDEVLMCATLDDAAAALACGD